MHYVTSRRKGSKGAPLRLDVTRTKWIMLRLDVSDARGPILRLDVTRTKRIMLRLDVSDARGPFYV